LNEIMPITSLFVVQPQTNMTSLKLEYRKSGLSTNKKERH